MRAPIFEEKVVDFLVELAKVTEKQVSREELSRTTRTRRPRPAEAITGSRNVGLLSLGLGRLMR